MLLLDALKCQNSSPRPPVWLMRQAGRYLPQYRTFKKNTPLNELFHNSDAIVHVTKMPLEEFAFDAAILFSDILMVLDAFDFPWYFKEGEGPVIRCDLSNLNTIKKREAAEVYPHIGSAIKKLKQELSIPLFGFAGGPFTIATYLLEKSHKNATDSTLRWSKVQPEKLHLLLEEITHATLEYLLYQIEAGVDAIQIFDSWAGLSPLFATFSLPYLKKLVVGLSHKNVPLLLFTRGACKQASLLANLCPTGLSLDWEEEMGQMRKKFPLPLVLQGNLDPELLCRSKPEIAEAVDRLLESMQGDPGYIFNLGHGILPQTPLENVHFLLEKVQKRL